MAEPTVTFPLQNRTFGEVISHFAKASPDKTAIAAPDGMRLTYAEFDRLASRYAHGFADLGIKAGDPVLVMLPDVTDYLLVWAGLARLGAIEVPTNTSYKGALLAHIFNDSRAHTIIVAGRFLEKLNEVAAELTSLGRLVIWPEEDGKAADLSPALARRCTIVPFSALKAQADTPFSNAPAFHDPMAIMFTSGTTGPSKGVVVSHAQAFAYTLKCSLCYDTTDESVLYTAGLPLFHCAGQWAICYAAFLYGATVVVRNGFRNEYFWKDVREFGCTGTLLLGAVGTFLWKEPPRAEDRDHTLKAVLMAPVIAEHAAFVERFGVRIGSCYGSTELPPVSVLRPGEEIPNRACTGRLQDDYEVRILDEFDREMSIGQAGEICVRPKDPWGLTTGYWMRHDATAKAFRNLWFHTGDAGYVDDLGRLYFIDRLTDSMRRRGENVSATEVEQEVLKHPDVIECAAYPVWDENTEQEIAAAIVPRPGASPDFAEMVTWLAPRLPYFMVPRYWRAVSALPRTASGKVQKYVLRESGITPDTWDRVAAGVKISR